jgi:hypothetical protein
MTSSTCAEVPLDAVLASVRYGAERVTVATGRPPEADARGGSVESPDVVPDEEAVPAARLRIGRKGHHGRRIAPRAEVRYVQTSLHPNTLWRTGVHLENRFAARDGFCVGSGLIAKRPAFITGQLAHAEVPISRTA